MSRGYEQDPRPQINVEIVPEAVVYNRVQHYYDDGTVLLRPSYGQPAPLGVELDDLRHSLQSIGQAPSARPRPALENRRPVVGPNERSGYDGGSIDIGRGVRIARNVLSGKAVAFTAIMGLSAGAMFTGMNTVAHKVEIPFVGHINPSDTVYTGSLKHDFGAALEGSIEIPRVLMGMLH